MPLNNGNDLERRINIPIASGSDLHAFAILVPTSGRQQASFISPSFSLVFFDKTNFMEAIIILKNEENNHRLMQIDLDLLAKNDELLEDVYDIIAIRASQI